MPILLTLLYLVCVYVRPGEIVPGWEGLPLVAILSGVSTVCVAGSLVVRRRPFWNLPQDHCVLGFTLAIAVSNLAWGWFYGAYEGVLTIAPAVFCYFLIRGAVTSPRHLRWIGYTLVWVTLFQALNGIAQYHTGAGLGDVAALEMRAEGTEEDSGDDAPSVVRRIRGTGIFNDPNDLALAFVVVTPFLVGPLVRRSTRLPARILAAVVLVPLLVALYYTNSRGGILGLGAALLPYCYRRFGKVAGPVVATAGLVALLAFGPSRMNTLDASESSAQGRVQSWGEGLQMFRSRPIFGVGFGRYTDFNELVAHNSFVHTLAELGLFGSLFFIGMGYWFFQSPPHHPGPQNADSDAIRLRAWGDDLRQGGLGLAVCAMFLSRQYTVLPFIWLAMSGCYRQVVQELMPAAPPRTVVHLTRIAAITIGAVVCTYGVVRILQGLE
jgi:putative inorganic carbon (hco3(-)) transporter